MNIKLTKIMLRDVPKFMCCEVSTVPLRHVPHLFCGARLASSQRAEDTGALCSVQVIITNLSQTEFTRASHPTSNHFLINKNYTLHKILYEQLFSSKKPIVSFTVEKVTHLKYFTIHYIFTRFPFPDG